MPDTPSAALRTLIDEQKVRAENLLDRARHETMKQQVALAIRDCDEALTWIAQDNFDSRFALHTIVKLCMAVADWRMNMVESALAKYGPDAMLIG